MGEKYMELLREAGYETFDDKGVIYAVVPDEKYTDHCSEKTYRELYRLREKAGYKSSWGVMPARRYNRSKAAVASS